MSKKLSLVRVRINCTLKIAPQCQLYKNQRLLLCKQNKTFSRFDIRQLTFAKFVEFLKISTIKASLNLFFYQREDVLTICLGFNKYKSMHA